MKINGILSFTAKMDGCKKCFAAIPGRRCIKKKKNRLRKTISQAVSHMWKLSLVFLIPFEKRCHYVALSVRELTTRDKQAGLELTEILFFSVAPVLELKACSTTHGSSQAFFTELTIPDSSLLWGDTQQKNSFCSYSQQRPSIMGWEG